MSQSNEQPSSDYNDSGQEMTPIKIVTANNLSRTVMPNQNQQQVAEGTETLPMSILGGFAFHVVKLANCRQGSFLSFSELKEQFKPNLVVHVVGSIPVETKDNAEKFVEQLIASVKQADGWIVCSGDESLADTIDRKLAINKSKQIVYLNISSWEAIGCNPVSITPLDVIESTDTNYFLLLANEAKKAHFCRCLDDLRDATVPMLHVVVGGEQSTNFEGHNRIADLLSASCLPAVVLKGNDSDFGKLLSDESEALAKNGGRISSWTAGTQSIQRLLKERGDKIRIISAGAGGTLSIRSLMMQELCKAKVGDQISILALGRMWDDLSPVVWTRKDVELLKEKKDLFEEIYVKALCNGQGRICQRLDELQIVSLESLANIEDEPRIVETVFKAVFVDKSTNIMANRVEFFYKLMGNSEATLLDFEFLRIIDKTFTSIIGCNLKKLIERRFETDGANVGLPHLQEIGDSERSARDPLICKDIRILFLFANVIHSDELATFIWRHCCDLIGTALFGARLAKMLAVKAKEEGLVDLQQDYENSAASWEQRAIGTIRRLHECHPKIATEWLAVTMPTWQDYSILEVADYAKQSKFMEQQAVQAKLKELWTSKANGFFTLEIKFWIAFFVTLAMLIFFSASLLLDLSWPWKCGIIWWALDPYLASIVQLLRETLIGRRRNERLANRKVPANGKCMEFIRTYVCRIKNIYYLFGPIALLAAFMSSLFELPRIYAISLYSSAHVVYWSTMFYFFYVYERFGTKVVMMVKMITGDLLLFFLLYAVNLIAFAVPLFANMNPAGVSGFSPFVFLFYDRMWHLVGSSLDIGREATEHTCLNATSSSYSCAQQKFNPFGGFLFLVFLVVTNIILLNMLIAMLSRTVESVFKESTGIWSSKRFKIISDFHYGTTFPPPFTFICRIVEAVANTKHQSLKKRQKFEDMEYRKSAQCEQSAATYVLNLEASNNNKNNAAD